MKITKKTLKLSLALWSLLFGALAFGKPDNLVLKKYSNPQEIPALLFNLSPGKAMVDRTFVDDDGNARSDKWYYTVTNSYVSKLTMKDLEFVLNPSNGRLDDLFDETQVVSNPGNDFSVSMKINAIIKKFDCTSNMKFSSSVNGNKKVFVYKFSNFNMVFTDIAIQVEVEEVGAQNRISLSQIAAMKGSAYSKLDKVWAIGKFESEVKDNIKKFKEGLSGI